MHSALDFARRAAVDRKSRDFGDWLIEEECSDAGTARGLGIEFAAHGSWAMPKSQGKTRPRQLLQRFHCMRIHRLEATASGIAQQLS